MSTQLYHEVNRTRKRCPHCGHVKPIDCFGKRRGKAGAQGWCKTCQRVNRGIRNQQAEVKAKAAAHQARPEVRERRRETEAKRSRTEKRRAQKRQYYQTLRGRLVNARASARQRLKHANTEERAGVLRALIALYDAELQRMDNDLAGGPRRPWRETKAIG